MTVPKTTKSVREKANNKLSKKKSFINIVSKIKGYGGVKPLATSFFNSVEETISKLPKLSKEDSDNAKSFFAKSIPTKKLIARIVKLNSIPVWVGNTKSMLDNTMIPGVFDVKRFKGDYRRPCIFILNDWRSPKRLGKLHDASNHRYQDIMKVGVSDELGQRRYLKISTLIKSQVLKRRNSHKWRAYNIRKRGSSKVVPPSEKATLEENPQDQANTQLDQLPSNICDLAAKEMLVDARSLGSPPSLDDAAQSGDTIHPDRDDDDTLVEVQEPSSPIEVLFSKVSGDQMPLANSSGTRTIIWNPLWEHFDCTREVPMQKLYDYMKKDSLDFLWSVSELNQRQLNLLASSGHLDIISTVCEENVVDFSQKRACRICVTRFYSLSEYAVHLKQRHNKKTRFLSKTNYSYCHECHEDDAFATMFSYVMHFKTHHSLDFENRLFWEGLHIDYLSRTSSVKDLTSQIAYWDEAILQFKQVCRETGTN